MRSLSRFLVIPITFIFTFIFIWVIVNLYSNQEAHANQANTKHINPDILVYWRLLENYLAYDFAIDPLDSANIYVGTANPTAFAYSRDYGVTWVTRTVGTFPSTDGYAIAIDPINPNYIYLGLSDGGIHRSDDSGDTWEQFDKGVTGNTTVSDLYVHPVTPTVIFGGSNSGTPNIYRSDDRGESWTAIPLVPDPTNRVVLQILSHPTIPNRIYATVRNEGVFVSEDMGLNWEIAEIQAEIIRFAPSNPNIVYKLDCSPYRSVDGGETWTQLDSPRPCYQDIHVDPKHENVIYLTSQYLNVTRSIDGGQNWQILGSSFDYSPQSPSFAIDPINTTRLYVGSNIHVSTYLEETIYLPNVVR